MNSSDSLPPEMPPGISSDRTPSDPSAAPRPSDALLIRRRMGFGEDFQRFFLRGLAALLPTLITLWLLVWVWDFLWDKIGQHLVFGIRLIWLELINRGILSFKPAGYVARKLYDDDFSTRLLGVALAVLVIYIVGVFVGNLLGRTMWRLAEHGVMKIPVLRGIYPAVKQVTDFVLSEKTDQFQASKVVAVEPHAKGIWSIGLVTGNGLRRISEATGQEMVSVFVPSSPTAFSGYVLVVPKSSVIELPLKVEEAMRLLVSGGVISPSMDLAGMGATAAAAKLSAASTGGAEELLSLRADGRALASSARVAPIVRETRKQQSA